jgi:hypothetical protein
MWKLFKWKNWETIKVFTADYDTFLKDPTTNIVVPGSQDIQTHVCKVQYCKNTEKYRIKQSGYIPRSRYGSPAYINAVEFIQTEKQKHVQS